MIGACSFESVKTIEFNVSDFSNTAFKPVLDSRLRQTVLHTDTSNSRYVAKKKVDKPEADSLRLGFTFKRTPHIYNSESDQSGGIPDCTKHIVTISNTHKLSFGIEFCGSLQVVRLEVNKIPHPLQNFIKANRKNPEKESTEKWLE
jgi:hypothetical protein